MKHLIKKSEFYDAYVDRKDYIEVFKNPTSKEADEVWNKNDAIRAFLHPNGDMYCWDGEVLHGEIERQFPNIASDYRISAYESDFMLMYLTSKVTSIKQIQDVLKNCDMSKLKISNNAQIEFDTDYYDCVMDLEYVMRIQDKKISDILALDLEQIEKEIQEHPYDPKNGPQYDWKSDEWPDEPVFTKINTKKKFLLKKAEFYDAFNINDDYIEIFKNPTNKEVDEIWNKHGYIRAFLHPNGDMYCWDGEVIHDKVNKKFSEISSPYRLVGMEDRDFVMIHITNEVSNVEQIQAVLKVCDLSKLGLNSDPQIEFNYYSSQGSILKYLKFLQDKRVSDILALNQEELDKELEEIEKQQQQQQQWPDEPVFVKIK